MLFLLGGWEINHYFLPDMIRPVSLGNNVTHSTATEALKSLPYLEWAPAEDNIQKSGIVKHDEKQSFQGINICNSRRLSSAYLMDMSGNVLHIWSAKINCNNSLHHVEMGKNGDLLAIDEDTKLIKLDWDSNIKWITKMRFHHDIAAAENKDIYTLGRKDEIVFISGLPVPILNDYVVVLSADGEIKEELSLYKVLKRDTPFDKVAAIYRWIINPQILWGLIRQRIEYDFIFDDETTPADIFHTNTIEVINRDINGLCKKGDLLIFVRDLDLSGILDVKKEELIWRWGSGNLSRQHHPTLLENGNILIFDNGRERGYSRIVELDPLTKKIVCEYKANPPDQFYSPTRGSSQRLPNGNTLITESDSGQVFEITKGGDIVWEFYNPEIKYNQRATIYRMMRITDPENLTFLREIK
ncbi:MAG TPA: arylsulfotransferase family protein [Thermodesulfobacteriota bacterium]|nr:arylsulfotransferase family protein [Thermodesulfobacteriota bacterium]